MAGKNKKITTRVNGKTVYKQSKVKGTDKKIDRMLPAKTPGWRISASGEKYFERRENRSDTEKERKYHGGVNRKPKPNSNVGSSSIRTSRKATTTKRVAPVRKIDTQKPFRVFDVPQLSPSAKVLVPTKERKKAGALTTASKDKKGKKLSVKELRAVVAKYEDEIRHHKTEHGLCFDEYGNVIYHASDGKTNRVYTPVEYKLAAKIFTHNHPSGCPFSWADIANLLNPQFENIVSEIHAVAPDGTIYILVRTSKSHRLTQSEVLTSYGKNVIDKIVHDVYKEEAHKNGLIVTFRGKKVAISVDTTMPNSIAMFDTNKAYEYMRKGCMGRIIGELENGLKKWAKEHNITYLKSHV